MSKVAVVYWSGTGNTEQMAEAIAEELSAQGVKNIVMHNVTKSHPSYIIADIFRYKGLIIGSPTYSNQIFPEVEALLSKILLRGSIQAPTMPALSFSLDVMMAESLLTRFREYLRTAVFMGWVI